MKTTIRITVYQDSEDGPSETPIPINCAVTVRYEPKWDPKGAVKEAHERSFGYLCEEFRAWLEKEFAESEAPITSIDELLADVNRKKEQAMRKEKRT